MLPVKPFPHGHETPGFNRTKGPKSFPCVSPMLDVPEQEADGSKTAVELSNNSGGISRDREMMNLSSMVSANLFHEWARVKPGLRYDAPLHGRRASPAKYLSRISPARSPNRPAEAPASLGVVGTKGHGTTQADMDLRQLDYVQGSGVETAAKPRQRSQGAKPRRTVRFAREADPQPGILNQVVPKVVAARASSEPTSLADRILATRSPAMVGDPMVYANGQRQLPVDEHLHTNVSVFLSTTQFKAKKTERLMRRQQRQLLGRRWRSPSPVVPPAAAATEAVQQQVGTAGLGLGGRAVPSERRYAKPVARHQVTLGPSSWAKGTSHDSVVPRF